MSSLHVTQLGDRGPYLAKMIRRWTWDFLQDDSKLPYNRHLGVLKSLMHDESLQAEIQEQISILNKMYLTASDVQDILNHPEMMDRMDWIQPVTRRTAQRWLKALGYRYTEPKKGMYIDGHE